MTTPDLDARVAAARAIIGGLPVAERTGGEPCVAMPLRTREETVALITDLHAALKAARGEETEAWAVCTNDGRVLGPHVGRAPRLHWIKAAAERACETIATARVERDLGLTVRRVLCRIAPDDGGEG